MCGNGRCRNLPGSFRCECAAGFKDVPGAGPRCVGMNHSDFLVQLTVHDFQTMASVFFGRLFLRLETAGNCDCIATLCFVASDLFCIYLYGGFGWLLFPVAHFCMLRNFYLNCHSPHMELQVRKLCCCEVCFVLEGNPWAQP